MHDDGPTLMGGWCNPVVGRLALACLHLHSPVRGKPPLLACQRKAPAGRRGKHYHQHTDQGSRKGPKGSGFWILELIPGSKQGPAREELLPAGHQVKENQNKADRDSWSKLGQGPRIKRLDLDKDSGWGDWIIRVGIRGKPLWLLDRRLQMKDIETEKISAVILTFCVDIS